MAGVQNWSLWNGMRLGWTRLIMEDLITMAGSLMVCWYNRKLWQGFEQGNDII